MKLLMMAFTVVATVAAFDPAAAQHLPPGGSLFNPPPPPPPPPPIIEAPVVPKLGQLPSYPQVQRRRPPFGDRIRRCLDEAAAAGLDPSERAAYSRSCAN
jgi:hypothetical protein